jgi:hypothetical protein
VRRPRQTPIPAATARFSPLAAARNTSAVSSPGVIVNKLEATRNAISACEVVILT